MHSGCRRASCIPFPNIAARLFGCPDLALIRPVCYRGHSGHRASAFNYLLAMAKECLGRSSAGGRDRFRTDRGRHRDHLWRRRHPMSEHRILCRKPALRLGTPRTKRINAVKYKNEILPGEQPLIMDRELFDAVRQKSLAQWSHRTTVRNKSDHLLAGLLFDDAGHRMVPTHATKAGVRYRYYVSTPFLHGEAKTASAGSVSRVPAADIEDTVVKSMKEHVAAKQDRSISSIMHLEDRGALAQLVAGVVVHRDRLSVRLKSDHADEASYSPDDQSLTIPWRKSPSKKSRQILLPHNASRSDVRPERFERRARLVSAIARGRRWLDDVVSGRVTTVAELCAREKCSVRQVNMTISLAFLAPSLVKATVEARLPRGIGVERLRDPPAEWSRQFEELGHNPE
jgi:site-specific DNA recombinase